MTVADVPGLDKQNGVTLGRILGRGTVGHAEEGSDGEMRATVRIPEDELVYEPGIVIMPHAGTLELTLINDDKNTHCAVLPCNGDYKFIWLVNHSKGTATLELDGPGYYWYGSTLGQRRGARPDRRDRRERRRPPGGSHRPSAAAAPVVRPPGSTTTS